MENLGIKKLDVGLAQKDLVCDECGKAIRVGRPYVQKANIAVENNQLRVIYRIECVQICSELPSYHRGNTVSSNSGRTEIVYDACWDKLPQEAGLEQRSGLNILTRTGIKVATGYTFIVEWEHEGRLNRYVEISSQQAVKSNFTRNRGEDDPYGRYQAWKTPDNFHFREYLQEHYDMRPGYFYFPAAVIRVAPAGSPSQERESNKISRLTA